MLGPDGQKQTNKRHEYLPFSQHFDGERTQLILLCGPAIDCVCWDSLTCHNTYNWAHGVLGTFCTRVRATQINSTLRRHHMRCMAFPLNSISAYCTNVSWSNKKLGPLSCDQRTETVVHVPPFNQVDHVQCLTQHVNRVHGASGDMLGTWRNSCVPLLTILNCTPP